jgi:hypothetical protein
MIGLKRSTDPKWLSVMPGPPKTGPMTLSHPRKLMFMGMYFERILFLRTSLFSESAQAKRARL